MTTKIHANRGTLRKKFYDNPVPSLAQAKKVQRLSERSRFKVKLLIPKRHTLYFTVKI